MYGGGAERIASILLHELLPYFTVHLAVVQKIQGYPVPDNVKEYKLGPLTGLPFLSSVEQKFWYYQFCKNRKIDYSISFMNSANYTNCGLKSFPYNWKGKVIICERNYSSLKFEDQSKKVNQKELNKMKFFYPKADLVIANAKRMALDLQETFGVSPQKTVTIYNPINLKKILETKGKIKVKSSTQPFTFLHVGSFKKQKNHQLLLDAFATTIKTHKAQLWLVGSGGDQEAVIRNYVQELKLSDVVFFYGRQSNPFEFMAKADCMVLSSDFEGLPNVILEGLTCSLPIISTDCLSGPREILAPNTDYKVQLSNGIEIGEYGILVPTKDVEALSKALIRVIEDANLCQALSKKGVERAKNFDSKNVIPTFVKAINSFNF